MNETYKKLVDLYAGNELPEDLTLEMEQAAQTDPELRQDMTSLRQTVETLQNDDFIFTEESYPRHLQYQLPMSG
jgi:hypothetical protein